MTANHDFERRIADFYQREAPQRAPDWVLGRALDSIDATPQRRVLIRAPWRFPAMNTYARLAAVAAVAAVAIGVVALWPGQPGSGSQPSPSITVTPSPRPGELQASSFEYPFTYVLPRAGWELTGTGRTMEFRVPGSDGADGSAVGVIVQAVTARHDDPCSQSSPTKALHTLFSVRYYLEALPGLEMLADRPSSVGLRPATTIELRAKPPTAACPQLYLWLGQEPFTAIPHGGIVETTAVDMGDGVLLISAWGLDLHPEWRSDVAGLIGSFRLPEMRSPAPEPSG